MGNPRRPSPLLESARRRRNQGNGVTNPRIVRLTAATVVAEPDAHQSSHRTRATALADAAWTLDKPGSISVALPPSERAEKIALHIRRERLLRQVAEHVDRPSHL